VQPAGLSLQAHANPSPPDPASSVPPPLPPSVEEAYRRKCIQLKQRTSEVEEANDAARLRLARLKRQVEKMRLERAFLLEQLAKRTSTNVEDSDGSPSPPPTVSSAPAPPTPPLHDQLLTSKQPKEKPLRVKRGHRKAPILANLDIPSIAGGSTPGSTFISQNILVRSSGSDALSAAQTGDSKANGVSKSAGQPPKKPGTAFDLYCEDMRKDKSKDAAELEDEALSQSWKELPESKRAEYESRAEKHMAQYEKDKAEHEAAANAAKEDAAAKSKAESGNTDKGDSTESDRPEASDAAAPSGAAADEDVEMANYDTDQETQVDKPDE
jgi:non-histone protein 10